MSLGSSTHALFCSQWDVSVIAKSCYPFPANNIQTKGKSELKIDLDLDSRQQQRKATAWHGWKPKPGEVKVESSKDDRLDLVFVRELLLPWRSLAPAVPNLVLLSARSQNTEKVMLLTKTSNIGCFVPYVILKAPRRGLLGLVAVSTPGKEAAKKSRYSFASLLNF